MNTTKKQKRTTYQKHPDGGKVMRWFATADDAQRLRWLAAHCATAGLLKPSHAVLVRTGLLLLEQHMQNLIALAGGAR